VAGQASLLFLEGYLYDKPKGKLAFERAAKLCQQAGGKAGIALSDPFCVDRHRDDFRRLVKDLDYVIGNEHEWSSLYQTDLASALEQASRDAGMVVCTRSGEEVILLRGEERAVVPVNRIVPVDATGAGDAFAGGFLAGLVTQSDVNRAIEQGIVSASFAIEDWGGRGLMAATPAVAAERHAEWFAGAKTRAMP
jgi:sugar/nucleoside kinase (ribokinase family)